MDPYDFGPAYRSTLSAIVQFTPTDNEVLFPIPVGNMDTNTPSQASITMKNMADCQLVAKVECSNPLRYKCDTEFAILKKMKEVKLVLTMLGSGDEGQHGGGIGTVTDPDAIVRIDEEGNVLDSVRISIFISPKEVWDRNGVPGK